MLPGGLVQLSDHVGCRGLAVLQTWDFGDWAMSTVKAGTNGTMVAAVSSSVTYLLTQAAYLAGHLPSVPHLPL